MNFRLYLKQLLHRKQNNSLRLKQRRFQVKRLVEPKNHQEVKNSVPSHRKWAIIKENVYHFNIKWVFQLIQKIFTIQSMDESSSDTLLPPICVRGMRVLDKDMFTKAATVPAIHIKKEMLSKMKKHPITPFILKIPGINPVIDLAENNPLNKSHKAILLKHSSCIEGCLKQELVEKLQSESGSDITINYVNLSLKYNNWNYRDILNSILPEACEGVGGYSIVGHIIHLNLKDELLDYKHVIGNVLLDKIPQATTVVNKLDIIDNTFRNFQMEVIAGEADYITAVKEHGILYKMDYSKVYWNSKLGTEHRRVVDAVTTGDIIFDTFAGVGPFAIPAAKKKCHVFANDLNPESFRWMNENVKVNHAKTVQTYNMDGRDFISTVAKQEMIRIMQADQESESHPRIHIVMNLPALAIQFTDVFVGLFSDVEKDALKNIYLPIVYCYCFSNAPNLEQDVKDRIESVMKWRLPDDCVVRNVRNVAPKKDMMCAMFQLSEDVLFNAPVQQSVHETDDIEPPAKKKKEET